MKYKKSIIYAFLIGATSTLLGSSEAETIILKKNSFQSDIYNSLNQQNQSQPEKNKIRISNYEYQINKNDLVLFKPKNRTFPEPKFVGGRFVEVENNQIFFESTNQIGSITLGNIKIDEVEAIYVGSPKTFNDLHKKWSIYLSLLIIPGSIQMAKMQGDGEIFPAEANAVITWALFSCISTMTYAPIIASIDFNKRLKKSTEFIIGPDNWSINY